MTVDEFLNELEQVRKTGRGWMALCPAHEDGSRSLSVAEGDDGRVLLHCFASCTADKITAALGLKLGDLFPGGSRDWLETSRQPSTPEERQAAENRRLRRKVTALDLDQQRTSLALHAAAHMLALAYGDDLDAVLERLCSGAGDVLERKAAAAADAYAAAESA